MLKRINNVIDNILFTILGFDKPEKFDKKSLFMLILFCGFVSGILCVMGCDILSEIALNRLTERDNIKYIEKILVLFSILVCDYILYRFVGCFANVFFIKIKDDLEGVNNV